MKNFTFLFILAFFLFFLFLSQSTPITLADNNQGDKKELKSKIKTEVEKFINGLKIQSHINRKEFEMKGIASSVTADSFVLNEKTILIDPTITKKLLKKGTLENGSYVKVEGKVIDDKLYAVHIKVRSNQEDDEDEASTSPTPTSTITSTPSITETPAPTPTTASLEIEDENTSQENKFLMQDLFGIIKNFLKELEKELKLNN